MKGVRVMGNGVSPTRCCCRYEGVLVEYPEGGVVSPMSDCGGLVSIYLGVPSPSPKTHTHYPIPEGVRSFLA